MKKIDIFGVVFILLLIVIGCGKNENEDFYLTLTNSLPTQIKTISIENESNDERFFVQDIDIGDKAEFAVDGDLDKIVIIITPKDMFSTSIEVDINCTDTHTCEYQIALEKNEIKLKKLNNSSLGDVNEEGKDNNNLIFEQENHEEIVPIVSAASVWSSDLAEKGEIFVDLNMDGEVDQIQISYIEKEGSQYISKFNLKIEGNNGEFVINDYNASFEKIELFDFNQDSVDEILLMFDTRGGGGEGTHEIYVLWIGTNDIKAVLLDPYVKGVENKVLPYNIDGVYHLEKIEYQGKIRLVTRQYMWGENGHSDKVGDLISIVGSLDAANDAFCAEVTWVDKL